MNFVACVESVFWLFGWQKACSRGILVAQKGFRFVNSFQVFFYKTSNIQLLRWFLSKYFKQLILLCDIIDMMYFQQKPTQYLYIFSNYLFSYISLENINILSFFQNAPLLWFQKKRLQPQRIEISGCCTTVFCIFSLLGGALPPGKSSSRDRIHI